MLLEKIISRKKTEIKKTETQPPTVVEPKILPSENPKAENQKSENSRPFFFGHSLDPCEKCGCTFFWQSIYGDGIFRCQDCERPPMARFVGSRFNLLDEQRRLVQVDSKEPWTIVRMVATRDASGATLDASYGLDDIRSQEGGDGPDDSQFSKSAAMVEARIFRDGQPTKIWTTTPKKYLGRISIDDVFWIFWNFDGTKKSVRGEKSNDGTDV